MQFIGRSGNEVLFVADSKAVIVNEQTKFVCSVGDADSMVASFIPDGDQTKPESSIPFELAVAATTDLDIKLSDISNFINDINYPIYYGIILI